VPVFHPKSSHKHPDASRPRPFLPLPQTASKEGTPPSSALTVQIYPASPAQVIFGQFLSHGNERAPKKPAGKISISGLWKIALLYLVKWPNKPIYNIEQMLFK